MAEEEELAKEEVEERIGKLDIWGVQRGKLVTAVEFDGYRDAVLFANQVFSLAEEEFHHPEVTVEYGKVKIDLETHEVDGLTQKDFEMAEKIEQKVRKVEWD